MPSSTKWDFNPNPIVQHIGKPANEFTKHDIIRFIADHGIRMLNFRYLGDDCRLKQLNFVIQSEKQLDRILTVGERVDGSNIFDFVAAESSDVYIVPRYRRAFVNPFEEEPTLDLFCSFYDVTGQPLENAPEQVLRKADRTLCEQTGYQLEALGELEYYLISEPDEIYPVEEQRGYHEAPPFSKFDKVRKEAMFHLANMGCAIKYGHGEVGNFVTGTKQMVQHEIEFLPVPITRSADQMALAKWVLREVAASWGMEVSFAPKIMVGQAGSGMHFHTRLMKDGKNVFSHGQGLTEIAHQVIGGYLSHAASLTAFGNTVPTSFLRLVPNQEAPVRICWGDRNRSALVRVPLGWQNLSVSMIQDANPAEPEIIEFPNDAQTIELRSPDGSAHVHFLLAGIACAAREGLLNPHAAEYAAARYVTGSASKHPGLESLPTSCAESADALLDQRETYEKFGVFPEGLIDSWAEQLKSYEDENLAASLTTDDQVAALVNKYFHVG